MAARVIQGFFVGGMMRPVPAVAPRVAQRRAAPVPAAAPPRAGPPPAAFAASAGVAQRFGGKDGFEIDPVQLGLARSGGSPLPGPLLAKMEAAFGADFSAVRVHVGPQAARIGAVAFTTGNDLYFAPGRYQPGSVQGQQLIGHELAHVIQQRQGRVRAGGPGVSVVQDHALESEADRLGMRAAMHRAPVQAKRAPGGPRPWIDGRAVQRSIAEGIKSDAKSFGARLNSNKEEFSLNKGKRSKMSWFSDSILQKLGVPAKPGSATCPACQQTKSSWNLDHVNPWRQFVAAAVDPDIIDNSTGEMLIEHDSVRALYNDPKNLWWICTGCNSKKSDFVLDSWDNNWATKLTIRGRKVDLKDFLGL